MGAGPLINLHNHTTFSDGDFSPEAVVHRAIECGFDTVAITDHLCTSKCRSLPLSRLDEYVGTLEALRDQYADRIHLAIGVELDTDPRRCDPTTLPYDRLADLDLVLLEYVNDDRHGGVPLDRATDLVSRIDTAVGLCHNDLTRNFSALGPEATTHALQDLGVFVEMNTAHIYRVDGKAFFEIAESYFDAFRGKVPISVGTDSHYSLERLCNVGRAYDMIDRLGLWNDLVRI